MGHAAGVRRRLAVGAAAVLALLGAHPGPGAAAVETARAVAVFPTDDLTVPDPLQGTGRRVALPRPDCSTRPTDCQVDGLLNQLDGFDLDPRLALRFDGPVDPAAVAAATTVTGGGLRTGVDRVVYDAATHTVYAHPRAQLAPATTYRLRSTGGASSTFTTLSATHDLTAIRRQLGSGLAYTLAGIPPAARGLEVEHTVPAAGAAVAYRADRGRDTLRIEVPPVPGAGTYVFGSYLAPSWLTAERVIPQTPTRGPGARVTGRARLPFVAILPAGTPPRGGWPVAVFGHGLTGLIADAFRAAGTNARHGIATIATGAVGHGGGPGSAWEVIGEAAVLFPAYGRGIDLDGDGVIGPSEGLGTRPGGPYAAVGFRDGLRETTADLMTLVRAVGRGLDADADGRSDLRRTDVTYYGQSLGGIYGTMLGGVDPRVRVLALNVPGGPILEIARLSPELRPLVAQSLALAVPRLVNGGVAGFTESMPLRGDPPVTDPAPGALAIQDFLARTNWLDRPGSPETFAPRLAGKRVLFQQALGDQTVPNPTSYTLLAAGHLFGRASLYRNDLTAQRDANPHAFLFDPRFTAGALPGQRQVAVFLATRGRTVLDPDGPGPVWEVPIRDPGLLRRLNFGAP